MKMKWYDATLKAIQRYSKRHNTQRITRQGLLSEELDYIVKATESEGQTPRQSLSRVLQDLREEGKIEFLDDRGTYLLLKDMNQHDLIIGQVIFNVELSKIFKCSTQGGMRRSHKTNTLVVVSDHTRGIYEDRWEGNILHYTGMGQEGDQSLTFAQNKTLAESNNNGVSVHLFEVFEEGKYLYQGQVSLNGKPYQEDQPDIKGNTREVWSFPLKLIDDVKPSVIPEETYKKYKAKKEKIVRKLSDKELDKRIDGYDGRAQKRETKGSQFYGSPEIKEKAKRLAKGICELCSNKAPFDNKKGDPYLEGHHIIRLADNGPDILDNVVALCPNCHRKMHVRNEKTDLNILKTKVKNR